MKPNSFYDYVPIKILNKSGFENPKYADSGSAGFDLKAAIEMAITIHPSERIIVPTGLYFQLPEGYEAQVRPRSGLAAKHGITVLNSPGTVDSSYLGEVKVILINHSSEEYIIVPGERIAQIVIARHSIAVFENIDDASNFVQTERGAGGFGSTGRH